MRKKKFLYVLLIGIFILIFSGISVSAAASYTQSFGTKKTNVYSLRVGKYKRYAIKNNNRTVSNTNLIWRSSNKKVATVSSTGVVKGLRNGKTTITVKMKSDSSKSLKFVVYVYYKTVNRKFTNVTSNPHVMNVGDTFTLKPSVKGKLYTKYTSSNKNIVTVNQNGVITAKKKGTAVITYTTMEKNCNIAKAYITVGEKVEKISTGLSNDTLKLKVGSAYRVKPVVTPSSATVSALKYSIADKTIATVSNKGLIRAKSRGTTVVTIKSTDGSGVNVKIRVVVQNTKNDSKVKSKIVAHRGLSSMAPENSIPAFELAGFYGFDAIECDVRVTKDGQIVVIHDASLAKMCSVDKKVSELTLAELRKYPIINGTNAAEYSNNLIPTLDEFIQCCNKYMATPVVEIKGNFTDDILQKLYTSVKKAYKAPIIISFYRYNLKWLRLKDPTLELQNVAWQASEYELEFCRKYKTDISVDYKSLTEAQIKNIQAEGMKVATWTINDLATFNQFKTYGLDFISTEMDFG